MSNLSPNLFGEYLEPEPSKPAGRPTRKSGNTGRRSGDIPMFESGVEIQKYVNDSVDLPFISKQSDYPNAMSKLWEEKLSEAKSNHHYLVHGSGIYKSIKEKGFNWNNPVEIHHDGELDLEDGGTLSVRLMGEGHHRVAAAAELERETGKPVWIPIQHDYGDGFSY